MSSSECEAAALYLGLSDTSASASSNQGNLDPPNCYFEGDRLQFNGDGTNTGDCGGGSGAFHDKCLCKGTGKQGECIVLAMDDLANNIISLLQGFVINHCTISNVSKEFAFGKYVQYWVGGALYNLPGASHPKWEDRT